MALIIENGTGLPDANSYVSIEEADAYLGARNLTNWTGQSEEVKEAALINATDYLNLTYGHRIAGIPLSIAQSMIFPTTRYLVVPTQVKKATMELAYYSLSEPLFKRDQEEVRNVLVQKVERIGPLTESTTYDRNVKYGNTAVRVPAAHALMKAFLGATQGGVYR